MREGMMAIRYVPKCQGRYFLCFQVSMEGLGCWEVFRMVREGVNSCGKVWYMCGTVGRYSNMVSAMWYKCWEVRMSYLIVFRGFWSIAGRFKASEHCGEFMVFAGNQLWRWRECGSMRICYRFILGWCLLCLECFREYLYALHSVGLLIYCGNIVV